MHSAAAAVLPPHAASQCGHAPSAPNPGARRPLANGFSFWAVKPPLSGCDVVMSEIYELLLASKNAAFVSLPSVSRRRLGTCEMLPKNITWRVFTFGS